MTDWEEGTEGEFMMNKRITKKLSTIFYVSARDISGSVKIKITDFNRGEK